MILVTKDMEQTDVQINTISRSGRNVISESATNILTGLVGGMCAQHIYFTAPQLKGPKAKGSQTNSTQIRADSTDTHAVKLYILPTYLKHS